MNGKARPGKVKVKILSPNFFSKLFALNTQTQQTNALPKKYTIFEVPEKCLRIINANDALVTFDGKNIMSISLEDANKLYNSNCPKYKNTGIYLSRYQNELKKIR